MSLRILANVINGLTLGFNPTPTLDVNFELNDERAKNFEVQRADQSLRYAINTNWRMTTRATFSLNLSTIGAGDLARTSSNRTIEGDAQWSYRFDARTSGLAKRSSPIVCRRSCSFVTQIASRTHRIGSSGKQPHQGLDF